MFDRSLAYIQGLSLTQKVALAAVIGSAVTLSGSPFAYRYYPRFAELVDDNRKFAMVAAAALAAPLLGYKLPIVSDLIPSQFKLPSFGAVHMGALHMGALAMRPNPIAFGSAHSLNGLAFSGSNMGALHVGGAHMGALHVGGVHY